MFNAMNMATATFAAISVGITLLEIRRLSGWKIEMFQRQVEIDRLKTLRQWLHLRLIGWSAVAAVAASRNTLDPYQSATVSWSLLLLTVFMLWVTIRKP